MACVSSCTDLYTAKLASRFFGADVGNWALIASLLSWFNWFFSTRSYSNNFECLFVVLALYYWPWPTLLKSADKRYNYLILLIFVRFKSTGNFRVAVSLATISILLRPTAALFWVFLGISLLCSQKSLWNAFRLVIDAAWIMYFSSLTLYLDASFL